MIKRIWHGYTTPERADDYEALLKAEVINGIEGKNIPGFRRIDVLRRPLGDEVEFITIMEFDSLDDVRAFVGDDYEQAYVPDEARAILKRFDERSQHYDVAETRAYGQEQPASFAAAPQAAAPVLPDNVWFVRSNGGSGSFPISREGHKVVAKFIFGMLGWGLIAAALVAVGLAYGPPWLPFAAPAFFAVGAALSAWYFINTARKHTDYSMTYTDYVKAKKNA